MSSDVLIHHKAKDYHFELAKDKEGKKLWHVEDAAILPPMFTSDRPLYARVPPEREELIEQDFFYAGMGEENFAHGYRYYNSPGADARRKGAVVCGPRVVKSTITILSPANPTIVEAGFENVTAAWEDSGDGTFDAHNADAKRTDSYGANHSFATAATGYFYHSLAIY
ncbi:MAG: hypothetical protein H8E40_00940 [Chloroflexi bacterium]|nr:hypothetical protein [Chloroflexota bacterium]